MEPSPSLDSGRVLWVAALTILASELAVLAIREAAVRMLHPAAAFEPLTPAPPIVDTFIGAIGAIVAFLGVAGHENPVRKYRRIAAAVLLLSFIPDVSLAVWHSMGADWPEAYALMTMHVAVWAICVTLLPGLAYTSRPKAAEKPSRTLSIL